MSNIFVSRFLSEPIHYIYKSTRNCVFKPFTHDRYPYIMPAGLFPINATALSLYKYHKEDHQRSEQTVPNGYILRYGKQLLSLLAVGMFQQKVDGYAIPTS